MTYYELNYNENLFNGRQVKKLREIAGGDTYTIIYLKMLLLGSRNDGKIVFDVPADRFTDALAHTLGEDVENIRLAIMYLTHAGLLAISDGNEEKPQQGAKTETVPNEHNSSTEAEAILKAWNEVATQTGIKAVYKIKPDTTRYKMLKKRIHDYGEDAVIAAIESIKQSQFLQGNNSHGWEITFDWFIKPNNFIKVLEGNYISQSDRGMTREALAREKQMEELREKLKAEETEQKEDR